MVPIPRPVPSTVQAIYRAYEAEREHYDSLGISVGDIGQECDRALWYGLHWASQPEEIDGRKLSIFETGNIWEDRLVADLERIGVQVYGQQDRIRLVGNHVRGKCDGKAMGVIEAPRTEHLLEFKSSKESDFNQIKKHGVEKAKPTHWGQLQLGMGMFGLTRALYVVVNKNTDERHSERVEFDPVYYARQLARAERIINTPEPPSRISEDPKFFGCMFCKHRGVCHDRMWPRVTCRSCIHSTPTMDGDAAWDCSRWSKPLSIDEQKAACDAHLFIPAMVPAEQIDVDEENEVIIYRLPNGDIYRDGAGEAVPANDNGAKEKVA